MNKIKEFLYILVAVAIAQSAGLIGSLGTISSVDSWYKTLVSPPLTPPDFIFGPVWLLLYTLMGIASYLVYKSGKKGRVRALGIYLAHLVVNTAWSLIFFGEQNVAMALGVIVLLDILIVVVILRFYKISRTTAYLLVPYLLWALFATYLNTGFFFLN
ncbi:MAG: TspO/MBR family protein [Patescibacteria group bacterium UBA2103]